MKKILFITSANLPTNPRLVKEIDTLSNDYIVEVIQFKFIHWSNNLDEKMRHDRKHISFTLLDVSKRKLCNWALWAFLEKICRVFFPYFKNCLFIAAGALSRKSLKIESVIRKNRGFDLIIAHTLPALYPTYKASKKWNIPFAFDIEDYDPGMKFEGAGNNYKEICELLYKKTLPRTCYISSSSPLIDEYTLKLIGGHKQHGVILNSFPQKEFQFEYHEKTNSNDFDILKIIWFSLTISYQRGLEQFFQAIRLLENENIKIELTLIGNLDKEFEKEWINPLIKESPKWFYLNIIEALPQVELHKKLSCYDIGLALEPSKDLNNSIALSNKIIAYAQAGLYIIATNSLAQDNFIKEDFERGIITLPRASAIAETIYNIYQIRKEIREKAKTRYNKALLLSWEFQSKSLFPIISGTLNK